MSATFSRGQVAVIDFPATPVAVLEHRGDPAGIAETVRRFIAWRKQAGLPPRSSATFGILHHDPHTTAAKDYRQDLCAATRQPIAANEYGVRAGLIPAGRCAVLRLIGATTQIRGAVQFLRADWLPHSGEAMRACPVFVQRVSFPPDVAEADTITDVFLPLR